MDVTSTSPLASQPTQSASAPPPEPEVNSDYETFLRMLTTQLENQDPLNPMESQDFAVQLATFSNVEQQTKTNSLLEDLARTLGASDLSAMSNWIGREAQISGTLPFTGKPMELQTTSVDGAVTSDLVVQNMQGEEVARLPIDPTQSGPLIWPGNTQTGAILPHGTYSFSIQNTPREGELPDGEVSAYLPVTEARLGPRGQTLLVEGGMEVSPDDVTALRNPLSDAL